MHAASVRSWGCYTEQDNAGQMNQITFIIIPRNEHQCVNWHHMQGHINLDQAVFPEGTHGLMLDILARAPLWNMGLNYRHGTGHGVGAALNVHEGPHSISFRCLRKQTLSLSSCTCLRITLHQVSQFRVHSPRGIRMLNTQHFDYASIRCIVYHAYNKVHSWLQVMPASSCDSIL